MPYLPTCPRPDLAEGARLARDCLADSRPLAHGLAELLAAARDSGNDCRLRGALLVILAVIEALAPDELPPRLRACLIHRGRWQQMDAILAGGGNALAELGGHVQQLYEQRPLRFARQHAIERILARREDEGRFKPMGWARSKPGTGNWVVPR